MGKIIIFEGPDGVGKSTIAKEMAAKLNIPLYKNHTTTKIFDVDTNSNHFANMLEYGDDVLLNLLKAINCDIIFDRSFVSEYVYSRVYNRHTNIAKIHELATEYANLNALVIYVHAGQSSFVDAANTKYMELKNAYAYCLADLHIGYGLKVIVMSSREFNMSELLLQVEKHFGGNNVLTV